MAKLNDELKQQQQLIDDLKQRMLDLRRAKENATNPADVAALSKQLRATSLDLGDAGQKFNNLTKAQTAATEWAKKLEQAQRGVALGFGLATGAMGGFVRAGLQGTTLGERLAFTQKQLAMQFASVFVPWIEKGVTALQHLTERFRGLTGEQQQQIARWTALGVSLMGSLVIVPRLTAALRALSGSLALSVAANPLTLLSAGIVGLLSMTDKGREALGELGAALMQVFEPLANIVSEVLVPALQELADLLSTAAGKWVAFGTLFAVIGVRIVTTIRGLVLAFGALSVSIGGAIAAALLLVGALAAGRRKDEAVEGVKGLAAQVAAGRMTREEARKQIEEEAKVEGFRAAEQERQAGQGLFGPVRPFIPGHKTPEEVGREREEEVRQRGLEALEKAGAGKKDRSDLTLARTGTEDARATIRRLEDAVLKVDTGKKTEEHTKVTSEVVKAIFDFIKNKFGKQDNRPDDPKAD